MRRPALSNVHAGLCAATVALLSLVGCGSDDTDPGPDETSNGGTSSMGGSSSGDGATGGTQASTPMADCTSPPSFSTMTVFDKCTSCHSTTNTSVPQRQGAPLSVNFDTYDAAAANADAAVAAVQAGRMPPVRGGADLTASEKEELVTWAACGTPP